MKKVNLLLMMLTCVLVCGPLMAQTVQPKIIDGHVHYNGDPAFLQKLLDKLESVDGMAFLLVPPADMDTAVPFIHAHPNRLIGFGSIKLDAPNVVEQVDRFHAAGFRGLGEITSSLHNYDDRAYWPVYERAARYHMILLFHTGVVARGNPQEPQDVGFDRMRATRLDVIARKFPTLTLIAAHMGNPDYAAAAEVGRWDPNLYFDLSGSSLIKKQNDYAFFKSIFWWSGVESPHTPKSGHSAFEKLVFGSDVFGGDLEEYDRELKRYREMLDACGVPKQAQENIFSGTLWRILQEQKAAMTVN
ncbi:MAG TPA: amidohydrolase family protein [Terriglobia bacterium]|nr:amidohydrolase family protein [Terriglobia bacterium]